MSDGADQWSNTRHRRANDSFVAERHEFQKGATATGDDDDIDIGVSVEFRNRVRNLCHRTVTGNAGVNGGELHVRPTIASVDKYVLFGVRILGGDEADATRKFGEWNLARVVEGAFRLQCCAKFFDCDEEVA